MEIIIKNWDNLSLTNIPDNEIELVKQNNEKVITDFNLSEEEKLKVYWGCILNEDFSIIETPEYLEKQMKAEIQQIDLEFQKAVQSLTSEYTPEEISSFQKKEEEAKKVLSDETYISEFLTGTLLEGESQEVLAEKIIENANAYSMAYTYLEKELRRKTKEIREKYA